MKLFISFLVVFMLIGFVSGPAMACDHDCGNCPDSDTCTGDSDTEARAHDGDDHNDGGDDDGGCSGDSCHI
jgi:hypothetical protein